MTDNTNPEVTCPRCKGDAGYKRVSQLCNGTGTVSNPGVSGLEVVGYRYRKGDSPLYIRDIHQPRPADVTDEAPLVTLAAAEAEIRRLNSDHLQSLTNRQLEISSLRAELEQARKDATDTAIETVITFVGRIFMSDTRDNATVGAVQMAIKGEFQTISARALAQGEKQ